MPGYPEARFITSANRPQQFIADDTPEVAFAGRSNAGKSSAINAIVGRRQLARTSKTPGRTQLVNFFQLNAQGRLVDLPGYGYARVTSEMQDHWRELMTVYFQSRRSLCGLFLSVDIRRGPGDMDHQMLAWCSSLRVPAHVLLTKSDKLGRQARDKTFVAAREMLAAVAGVQLFSAHTGEGVEIARSRLAEMLGQKNAPGAEYRGTLGAQSPTGLGNRSR